MKENRVQMMNMAIQSSFGLTFKTPEEKLKFILSVYRAIKKAVR